MLISDVSGAVIGGKFGQVNPRGIMFYNKLIDNLLERGIKPFVTIHHHDIPQELVDRYGGWLSPLMQEDFVYFAEICFKSFGDRIKNWITMNEPNLLVDMSYIRGWYPPAHCSPPFGNCSAGNSDIEPLIAMHNMILGHAKALKQGGSIGIVGFTEYFEPLRDNEFDRQAVSRALAFTNACALPTFSPEEINYVKGSLDFIDCIHSACISGWDRPIRGFVYTTGERDGEPIGGRCGIPSFFVVPEGMEKIVSYMKERYSNMPMFVTENGFSPPQQNNQVQDLLQDTNRVDFHKSYLAALARAIRNGADVRGYFVWSLIDNFEWIDGYSQQFGLYYVDRQTLERVPKLSAKWYKKFLANGTTDHSNEEDFTTRSFGNTNATILGSEASRAAI
uniref:Beta-glucosidase n=1 Tax=Salix viminalis TaxID=40686 RepID=A0A6N2LMW4_SALVM